MPIPGKIKNNTAVITCYSVCALIIFFPVLNNAFLSDDYDSLYRILIEKQIIYKEFFRPLIDVSFFLNYLISGLHPWSYYVVNLMLHIASGFMVYKVANRFVLFDEAKQWYFAFASGLLFIIYPFHNEGTVWLTGRLASVACFCALLALYWSMHTHQQAKYFFAGVIVFWIALLGYESIILLPFIIIAWNITFEKSIKQLLQLFFAWLLVAAIYLIVRKYLAETIAGDYGNRLFADFFSREQILKAVKVIGRTFLPPLHNSKKEVVLFCIGTLIIIIAHFFALKDFRFSSKQALRYTCLFICFAIAMALPCAFGISTKTSEGDRLLYFPSAFLCMMIAFLLFKLVSKKRLWISLVIIGSYFIFFLLLNNNHWEKASAVSEEILKLAKDSSRSEITFINIPQKIDGAFVFTNGFKKALVLNKIDTSHVHDFNFLDDEKDDEGPIVITPEYHNDAVFIYPSSKIIQQADKMVIEDTATNKVEVFNSATLLYYWNKNKLNRLILKKNKD